VLGVTGGIASGKTTVANMLEDLGVPIIDFDLLSRQVVEPGQPAFKDITDYFGDGVIDKTEPLIGSGSQQSSSVIRQREKY